MDIRKIAAIAERCGVTFGAAFIGVYVMSGLNVHAFTDASLLQKAENAGLAALGALILSLLGGNLGSKSSPSLLPARLDPVTDPTSQAVKDVLNEHARVLTSHAEVLDSLTARPAPGSLVEPADRSTDRPGRPRFDTADAPVATPPQKARPARKRGSGGRFA